MAIDATIPLSGNKPVALNIPEAYASGLKLNALALQPDLIRQQIAASKASQASTEAGTPGIRADSEIKQKAADFSKWRTANAARFIKDGKPDVNLLVNAAAQDGFFTEAQAVATHDLENKSKLAANATSDQNRAMAEMNMKESLLGHAANMASFLPPDKQAAFLKQAADFAETKMPGLGAQLAQTFGTMDPQSGQFVPDPDKINAAKMSTITPETQVSQGLQTRQTAVSEKSQGLAEKVSTPGYKAEVEDVVPAGTKADAYKTAAGEDRYVSSLGAGISAIDNKEIKELLTKPGALLSNFWNSKIGQSTAGLQLRQAVDSYNARHPTAPIADTDGHAAIRRVLATDSQIATDSANKNRSLASGGTFSGAGAANLPPVPGQGPKETPRAGPQGGTVRMKTPDGQLKMVKPEQMKRALELGLTPIGAK